MVYITVSLKSFMMIIVIGIVTVLITLKIPFCLILQGDGTLLATGAYDGQARIWNTNGIITDQTGLLF